MRTARLAWCFALLVVFTSCEPQPAEPEGLSVAGAWTATVRGLARKVSMSMTLGYDMGNRVVTGSGRWDDTDLRIDGGLAGSTVTLLMAAQPKLGTLRYDGTVVDDGDKMVGELAGSQWSPPVRVEFSRR
jgi:hypothetical protein